MRRKVLIFSGRLNVDAPMVEAKWNHAISNYSSKEPVVNLSFSGLSLFFQFMGEYSFRRG